MAKIISTDHLKKALEAVDEAKMDDKCAVSLLTTANNYPYHRIAKYVETVPKSASDSATLFYISHQYVHGSFGLIRVDTRTDTNASSYSCSAVWLVRHGFEENDVRICSCVANGEVHTDLFEKAEDTYRVSHIQIINSGNRNHHVSTWEVVASYENPNTTTSNKRDSYECWKTVEDAAQSLYGTSYVNNVPAIDGGTAADIPSGGKEGQVLKWVSGAPKWADA